MNIVKQLHYKLSTLTEPLTKQTVTIDLDESNVTILTIVPNREFLGQGLAQRGFTCTRRTMKEKNTIKRDDSRIDIAFGE